MDDLHRVRRWRWQARAPDGAAAFALRRVLREQHEACENALAQAASARVPPGQVWHVPRLELSLRFGGLDELQPGVLAERVAAALHEAIAQLDGAGHAAMPAGAATGAGAAPGRGAGAGRATVRLSDAAAAREALRHYLATGLLPWGLAGIASEAAHATLAGAAAEAVDAVLGEALAPGDLLPRGDDERRVGALLRWLALLAPATRRRWVARHPHAPGWPADLALAWRGWIDADPPDRLEWQALWLAWPVAPATLRGRLLAAGATPAGAPPFAAALAAAIEAHGAPAGAAAAASAPDAARTEHRAAQPPAAARFPAADAPTGWLVPLAGLVLLHPWLALLLGACGALEADGRRIAAAQRPRAHALLHALACGDAEPAEHQLPFVKLLLGGPPDEPFDRPLPRPGPDDIAEIDALLDAVRGHWSALRGTGVEGLRLSFLQRRGLLSAGDTGWRLRMQAEPFDLLLGTLPWAIGLVRLPWMRTPLTVEWHAP